MSVKTQNIPLCDVSISSIGFLLWRLDSEVVNNLPTFWSQSKSIDALACKYHITDSNQQEDIKAEINPTQWKQTFNKNMIFVYISREIPTNIIQSYNNKCLEFFAYDFHLQRQTSKDPIS